MYDEMMKKLLEKEGAVFPSLTYKKMVIEPAYDSAKQNFVDYMMQINIAHLVMLNEQGLVTDEEVKQIGKAIFEIDREFYKGSAYAAEFEDLFFRIEGDLIQRAGDVAGNVHIARSRNDMGIAIYRMALRKKMLSLMEQLTEFHHALNLFARENVDTIMIGYTHTQQAQPTTLAHYVKALMDKVERDFDRLKHAYETVNRSSMGAAALTTSGFAINRERMKELLGFDGIIENSWDSVAGADYLMEAATAVQLCALNLGRSMQDFLQWATLEFDAFKLANPYVQISSIMPQKRNPVSLEHTRALCSSVVGDTNTVLTMIHNTPFGDIVDTEDDLQPYLWKAIDQMNGIYELLTGALLTMKVNKEKLEQRARESFANVTELADTLVRVENISFRQAHTIVSEAVRKVAADGKEKLSDLTYVLLKEVGKSVIGRDLHLTEKQFVEALDPRHFVEIRTIMGGPSPETMKASLSTSAERMDGTKQWLELKKSKLTKVESTLQQYEDRWSEA